MIVLDASAAVELLLGRPGAEAVREWLARPGESLHAPHLLDLEIASVLRREAGAGRLNERRAREEFQDFADLPIVRYPHDLLLPRVWGLRPHVTAYDAAYVALAEALDGTLLTLDRRLARTNGHRARVEVVGDPVV